MARPQTASDEVILQAAQCVISRQGYDAFTLSEVAAEVGLSRAAIILRFKSTHALKIKLTELMVERFCLKLTELPHARGGDGLLELAAFIGRMIADKTSLTSFFRVHHANLKDEQLAALERKRGEALRLVIAQRMPALSSIKHDSAVIAFAAHLSGSILGWDERGEEDACAYLVARTKEWLKLAHTPYNAHFEGHPAPEKALQSAS